LRIDRRQKNVIRRIRELGRLNIPQDDLSLGGNGVHVFDLKTPFTRFFREPGNKNFFGKKEGEKPEGKKK
jgi:hypothetical protein